MPYIKQEDRNRLLDVDGKYKGGKIRNAGELNFLLTIMFLSNYWKEFEHLVDAVKLRVDAMFEGSDKKYQDSNDVMGALFCCSREFKRRFAKKHPRPASVLAALDKTAVWFYNTYTAPYEKIKIKENGDVI